MRKLGWFAMSTMVAAVIAASVLLLAANLYVQSQGAQQRIRQTLTTALRVPVTLKKTTITPWEGLRLDGIALHAPQAAAEAPVLAADGSFLTADSFRVLIAWWPLLTRHEVIIEEILLDHPRLSWTQDSSGRWVWPASPVPRRKKSLVQQAAPATDAPGAAAPSPTTPEVVESPPASPPPPTSGAEAASESGPSREMLPVGVQRFRVRHGSLDFLNEHGKPLAHFEEVDVDGNLTDQSHATGEFRFQRAAFAHAGMHLTNFRSAFTYDDLKGLSINRGKGEIAGGDLLTEYKLHTHETGTPFSAECRIDNVDLSRLIKEAGSPLQLMEGRLQGEMRVQGASDDPSQRKATGQLRLEGAQLRNFPVLQLLGEVLRIQDLSHLQFKKAELDCNLDGDDVRIEPINLISNNLQIWAQGRYSANEDQLAVHGKLIIDQAVSHQLPQYIEMNFTPCGDDAPGSRYIEFDVTGPLNRPSTNLVDRMLAGPTNGLLQNLLAPKPKKPRNKAPKPGAQARPPVSEGDGDGL